MRKVKSSTSSSLRQYISEFKDVFTSDNEVLFCQECGKSTVAQQHSQFAQHLSGSKHNAAAVGLSRQSLTGESSATSSSRPSRFAIFATVLYKSCVRIHATF
jgi:hypothetical protein